MLSLVKQAFVGRAEIRAPLKTPAWEARVLLAALPLSLTLLIKKIIFPPKNTWVYWLSCRWASCEQILFLSCWVTTRKGSPGCLSRVQRLKSPKPKFRTSQSWSTLSNWFPECEIFTILSSAPAWTSVVLAGRGSRRHSTTSFSENVEVMETSYQMLDFIILRSVEGATSFIKGTVLTFLVKNGKMKLSKGVYILRISEKAFKLNLVLVVVLVL